MIERVAVYLLAGGRSSRFGSDKARAETPEGPLLRHVAARMEPVATQITVVADRIDKYADLGLQTIADEYPGRGPLCGILTALRHHSAVRGPGWILVASCDLVGVRHEWARALIEHAQDTVDAVAFRGARWEPLFALYHTRLQSLSSELLMGSGNASPARLLDTAHSQSVPLPAGCDFLTQANTTAELQRLFETEFADQSRNTEDSWFPRRRQWRRRRWRTK
jgi:molybdopterin-guanine dinucleotide biosynthesis protein A